MVKIISAIDFIRGSILRIFIDTEFTDFLKAEIISIGLVAQDGRELYLERSDYPDSQCSAFVREAVLSQLGHCPPECILPIAEMRLSLRTWLNQFAECGAEIAFDFATDWTLFCDLLNEELPGWITGRNIAREINQLGYALYFMTHKVKEHHALHDARANRFAWRPRASR